MQDTSRLLKVPEVAAELRASRRFVDAEIAAGRLPVVRLSRKMLRVRPGDLAAYIERSRTGGHAL